MAIALARGMTRFTLTFALIAALGCDKSPADKKDPAAGSAAGSAVGSAAPVGSAAEPGPGLGLAAAAGSAGDETLQTGALDFEMVKHAGTFTLRDKAYELVFKHEPSVKEEKEDAPNGMKLKTLSAMAEIGNTDAYGLFMLTIPKNVPYNVDEGIKKARDGAFNNVGVKLVSDDPATVGGMPGRRAVGKGKLQGIDITLEIRIVFDKNHHALLGLMGVTGGKAMADETTAFFDSLKIKDGEGPPAGDGT